MLILPKGEHRIKAAIMLTGGSSDVPAASSSMEGFAVNDIDAISQVPGYLRAGSVATVGGPYDPLGHWLPMDVLLIAC